MIPWREWLDDHPVARQAALGGRITATGIERGGLGPRPNVRCRTEIRAAEVQYILYGSVPGPATADHGNNTPMSLEEPNVDPVTWATEYRFARAK